MSCLFGVSNLNMRNEENGRGRILNEDVLGNAREGYSGPQILHENISHGRFGTLNFGIYTCGAGI